MADLRVLVGHQTAQLRHDLGRQAQPFCLRQGPDPQTAKRRAASEPLIEVARSVADQLNRVLITGARSLAPANETVARQHNPPQSGILREVIPQA